MNKKVINKVYLVSGPAGVGKSTTSKELVKSFKNSAYISGDYISHMHVNGRKKPWESQEEASLIWVNILGLTKNFLKYGNDVVVDYVTFPKEANWFWDNLKYLGVEVIYVVLWTDNETLMSRDNLRIPSHRMGERCLILVDEFNQSEIDKKHIFDTSSIAVHDITSVINEIVNNPKFKTV